MKITRELQIELYAWNKANERARDEYAAHPIVALEEDWCANCCYPRIRRNCTICAAIMLQRNAAARRTA